MSSHAHVPPAVTVEPRPASRLPLLVIPILSTAFGAAAGRMLGAVVPMAAFGLAWGVAAATVAPRLARRGARPSVWADLPLYLAMPLAFVVLGAALLGDILAATPQAQLDLLQWPQFGLFFYAIHGPFEWILMPLVVMLNWERPARRRLVVAAAVAFYAGRLASALYFAPNALAWGADPAGATLDEVQMWMTLNWARTLVQDLTTAILLLLATILPCLRPSER